MLTKASSADISILLNFGSQLGSFFPLSSQCFSGWLRGPHRVEDCNAEGATTQRAPKCRGCRNTDEVATQSALGPVTLLRNHFQTLVLETGPKVKYFILFFLDGENNL